MLSLELEITEESEPRCLETSRRYESVAQRAPYHDDNQSPYWVRDYPSDGDDAIAYRVKGNLYNLAAKAGIMLKNYGE
jgi:hypothetical protein